MWRSQILCFREVTEPRSALGSALGSGASSSPRGTSPAAPPAPGDAQHTFQGILARTCASHVVPTASLDAHQTANTELSIISILQTKKRRLRAVRSCCLRVTRPSGGRALVRQIHRCPHCTGTSRGPAPCQAGCLLLWAGPVERPSLRMAVPTCWDYGAGSSRTAAPGPSTHPLERVGWWPLTKICPWNLWR